ncbi:regulator of G-protein signaling 20-like [Arapaima gigas]
MWQQLLHQLGACHHGDSYRTSSGDSDIDHADHAVELVSCQPMGSERMEMRRRQRVLQQGADGDGGATLTSGTPASNACCFCWCCCCSCSCLTTRKDEGDDGSCVTEEAAIYQNRLVRTTFISHQRTVTLGLILLSQTTRWHICCPRPSVEEVRSWGQSFDKLMKCPAGRRAFREFLRTEFSEENMLFWLACEDLHQETNKNAIEQKANHIYEDYISILSPKEVSLDARVREAINKNMLEPTCHTFDEAQLQIYTLMQRDSYPRFMNSSSYKTLLQTLSQQSPEP